VFAQERLHLLRNGRIEWSAWWNPAGAHLELSALPTTDRILTYLRGQALGNRSASMVGKQIGYDPTRAPDGSISGIAVQSQSNGFGLEWGTQLSDGFEVFTGASDGDAVDFTAVSTDFGLQAYAHVLAITGTQDVDIEITDSANGTDFATIGSGVAFPTFTGVGSARIQTDRDETIRRHLRVELTGTFTTATVLVSVTRNLHEVQF
jgi:hypothetical protein